MVIRVGDLEIAQDLRFQGRSWAVQRLTWAAMAGIIAIALLGYFGAGPRSDGRVVSANGAYSVEYARYGRYRAPEAVRVAISGGAVEGDEARVHFDRRYFDGVEVQAVLPEPESVEVGGDEVIYAFKLLDRGEPATVIFNIRFDDIGRKRAALKLAGHPGVSFSQFVYP